MHDVKITDLFPEAAQNYSEPSTTIPAAFIASVTVLVLVTFVALILL